MSLLGIVLGLVLLIALSYRGYSIIWVAPFSAFIVALFGFGVHGSMDAYTGAYMQTLASFTSSWMPIFLFGAIFGKLMDVTGAARAVAHWMVNLMGARQAMLGVILSCAILTYGGVSLFVVVFAIYPLALSLFKEANISQRLIPGAIALGSFTFTMTALPGSPQLPNLIASKVFGTSAYAGALLGVVASVIMFVLGYGYLLWYNRHLQAKGLDFSEDAHLVKIEVDSEEKLPSPYISLIPLVIVLVMLYVLSQTTLLTSTTMSSKDASLIGLLCGIIFVGVANISKAKKYTEALSSGANGAMVAIINTAAVVGFGGVVKVVPGFEILKDLVLNIKGGPLLSEALSVSILSGATGSSSGGLTITLDTLGQNYIDLSNSSGIPLEVFHRIANIAAGGLDSLPHCGAVITLLAITGMTHKKSYTPVGMVSVVIPLIALAVDLVLAGVIY